MIRRDRQLASSTEVTSRPRVGRVVRAALRGVSDVGLGPADAGVEVRQDVVGAELVKEPSSADQVKGGSVIVDEAEAQAVALQLGESFNAGDVELVLGVGVRAINVMIANAQATTVDISALAPAPSLTADCDTLPPAASPPRKPQPMLARPRATIS